MTLLATAGGETRPDLTGSWPIVGRADHVGRVLDLLTGATPRAVVIVGAPGTGRSRLLAEVGAAVDPAAIAIERVSASHSASSIPFGALAPLLGVDDVLADGIVGVFHRATNTLADRDDGREVVLFIDDAHLLDEASATLISELSFDGGLRVALSLRSGEPLGASLASLVNASTTASVELRDLSRADIDLLTAHVLGTDVDGAVVQALWDGSQGNALYFRELLVAAIEAESIRLEDGTWRLMTRPTVPSRLVELIEGRLASIDEPGRAGLELLAVGHTVGREVLEELVGTEVVSEFVERGLVLAGRDGRRQPLRLQHPLYEEALRHRMSSRRLRSVQLQLAELLSGTGLRRRSDRLHATTLRLDAGGRVDRDLLEAAAMAAYFALDLPLAERLARAGVAAGGGARLRRVLAQILRYQGRCEEAESIISTISLVDVNERERALTAIVRAENLFRGLGERDAAMRVLRDAQQMSKDPAWHDEAAAMAAELTALSGDLRTALAAASPIVERGPSRAMAAAATATVAALTFMGRSDDAIVVAEQALTVASGLEPQENLLFVATHMFERCLGLVESGRLTEAEASAQLSYRWSLAVGQQVGQGWFALILARSAHTGGRLEDAARLFREAAHVFRDLRDHGVRRFALAGLAQTAATLGRVNDAAVALNELDSAPATPVQLLEAEVIRARAWLALARGAHSDAKRLLLDAAEWASSRGQHGLELTMLHDLVRISEARVAAPRTVELASTVQGDLAAARGMHAAGALAQDGNLLDRAADTFAEIAANLYAAEASAHAAIAHRRAGRTASSVASAARSEELASRCDGAATPALDAGTAAAARLTPRERELATLASRGMHGPEIAAQLGISVRTVNNLLQRAYTKLGISGRSELAARLAQS